jgi:FAD/FMN-containing dehydrogenase
MTACAGQNIAVIPFGGGTSLEGNIAAHTAHGGLCVDFQLHEAHCGDEFLKVMQRVKTPLAPANLRTSGKLFAAAHCDRPSR